MVSLISKIQEVHIVPNSKQRDDLIEVQTYILGLILPQTDGNGTRLSVYDTFWSFLVQRLFSTKNEEQVTCHALFGRNARGYRMVDGQKWTKGKSIIPIKTQSKPIQTSYTLRTRYNSLCWFDLEFLCSFDKTSFSRSF